ncbi:MAG: L,D-transpeptidase [bacterium]|nr:L,D-transpeptidase [bacterium]
MRRSLLRRCGAVLLMLTVTMTLLAGIRHTPANAQDFLVTNTPRAAVQNPTAQNPAPTTPEAPDQPLTQITATPRVSAGGFDPSVCAAFTDGRELSAECAAMIAQFPRPIAEEVPLDGYTLSTYTFFRVGPDPTPTFDAPNGNVTGEIPQGFNFVRAVDLNVDGWLQIEDGRWLQRERAREANPSYFRGVTLSEETVYPFAWVLDLSRIHVSRFPGGEWDPSTERWLDRYERVNIFSTAYDDEGWRWYMIGPNHWVEQRFVAKVQPIAPPSGVSGRWIAVDLYEQTLIAYEDDTPVYATLISSGLERTETNEGLFNIWARMPIDPMSGATGAPNAYALQSVPWVMYFDGSISLHGTYWHDLFGYRQSRGCVNLTISDARWLFEWTGQGLPDATGNINTPVYVYSSGEYGVTASGL